MTPYSPEDLAIAMDRLGMLPFFPSEPRIQAQIQALLVAQVPHREALLWLVDQFVKRIGKWHGPAELLGVLDTRYRPLDGNSYWSTLPGYSGEDGEARFIEANSAQHELTGEGADMLRQLTQALPRMPAASEQRHEEPEREAK